jgi:hypothetical protein
LGAHSPDHVPVAARHRGRAYDTVRYGQGQHFGAQISRRRVVAYPCQNVFDGCEEPGLVWVSFKLTEGTVCFYRISQAKCHTAKILYCQFWQKTLCYTYTMAQKELVLDARRRTSLAKVGRKTDYRYIVDEREDGTLVLTPAALISQHELNLLRNPNFLRALEQAESGQVVRRGHRRRQASAG